MKERRLEKILDRFERTRVLVVGDFFLDKYLVLDASLTEVSLETGLDAYQVVEKRLSPGAAGTITCNLKALGAGTVYALGMVGIDGEGYELKAGLKAVGVQTDLLVETSSRFTPTYTKPMLQEGGRERELNRIDIKNRERLPADVEQEVIGRLRQVAPLVDAVVVADQVQERNFGVITDAVREELSLLSQQHGDTLFIADSRMRIGEFKNLWIKPNRFEAYRALRNRDTATVTLEEAVSVAKGLQERTRCPVYVTLSEEGIVSVRGDRVHHIPTLRQGGTIDTCGAGDSVMAGIALALSSGAEAEEAAVVGNLVASITVQQIGVTGTASREEVLERFRASGSAFEPRRLE